MVFKVILVVFLLTLSGINTVTSEGKWTLFYTRYSSEKKLKYCKPMVEDVNKVPCFISTFIL
uniref:Uncharacterized protein n=1 Tax=Octopus bimaculoides TaxID=37653 RepID=A0A0L8I0Q4_OCTBM